MYNRLVFGSLFKGDSKGCKLTPNPLLGGQWKLGGVNQAFFFFFFFKPWRINCQGESQRRSQRGKGLSHVPDAEKGCLVLEEDGRDGAQESLLRVVGKLCPLGS